MTLKFDIKKGGYDVHMKFGLQLEFGQQCSLRSKPWGRGGGDWGKRNVRRGEGGALLPHPPPFLQGLLRRLIRYNFFINYDKLDEYRDKQKSV